VKLNLARVLSAAGMHSESVDIYNVLEQEGALLDQPRAWLSLALARAEGADVTAAEQAARSGLATAAHDADGAAAVDAVKVLVQLKCVQGQPEDAFPLLESSLPQLASLKAPGEGMKELWLVVAAAVATIVEPEVALASLSGVISRAKVWSTSFNCDDARFISRLLGLKAQCAALHGACWGESLVIASKAVHTCPWAREARVALANASMDASQSNAESVLRIMDAEVSFPGILADEDSELLNAVLSASASAAMASCMSSCKDKVQRMLAKASAGVHLDPTEPRRWYAGALLATKAAAVAGTVSSYRKALSWCYSALAQHGAHVDVDNSSRLLVCISECLLHLSKGKEEAQLGNNRALTSAKSALEAATSDAARAEALRQVARCYWESGDVVTASESYKKVIEGGGPSIAVLASLELAQMLERAGQCGEAIEVLRGQASRLHNAAGVAVTSQNRRHFSGLRHLVLLRCSLVLCRLGELEAARTEAESAEENAKDDASKALALVARGAACLQLALSPLSADEARNDALGEARRSLAEAVHSKQCCGVIPRTLLAYVEHAGSFRKKAERVAMHVNAVLKEASRPVNGELLLLLAVLLESRALHAKAVHSAPWQHAWWDGLAASLK